MKVSEVRGLKLAQVESEFPFRVEIVGSERSIYGAGVTLSAALMRAFSVSGMFPDRQFSGYTERDLASFIFWNFDGSKNWLAAIRALETAS